GQKAEQEDSQHGAVSDGSDGKPDFDYAPAALGKNCQGEEHQSPDEGGGAGVQGGAQVGHGGGQDGGNQQPGDTPGHVADDECGEDAVRAGEGRGRREVVVEDEECGAHQQKERELYQDEDAAGEQRALRLGFVLGGEQALHHELVGAVAGRGKEGAANQAGPEGVGAGEGGSEVENAQLAGGGRGGVDRAPAAGNQAEQGDEANSGAADVDDHLDDVGPDDGGHAALEGINQGEQSDDGDRGNLACTDGDGHDNGDGENAHAFSGGTGNEEESGGQAAEARAKASLDELVGGVHFAAEV